MDKERLKMCVFKFVIRAMIGLIVIYLVNEYLMTQGISTHVGMNGISFVTSGLLGVPGVALLYGITFYRIL